MTVTATIFAAVGAIAAVVTAVAAIQINKSTAGRATVLLKLAGYEPLAGTLSTVTEGKFSRRGNESPFMELAQVVVENPGRFPVTIREVTLRLYGTKAKRRTVTPRVFELANMRASSASTDTYKRLGAYDHVTYLMDFWSVVDGEFEKDPTLHKVTMKAEVAIAGHRRVFQSGAKWVFYSNTLSALKDRRQRRIQDIVLTELVRGCSWDNERSENVLSMSSDLGMMARAVSSKISLDSSDEDIDAAIREAREHRVVEIQDKLRTNSFLISFGINQQFERIRRQPRRAHFFEPG